MQGLYIVATPIGNLGDITVRALEILKTVDLIVCEDTRVTKRLLDHYQIVKPLLSYHQHSDDIRVQKIIRDLQHGKSIAFVTDSGTPGISDPGNKLVAAAIEAKINVVPIPGPSAIAALLSVAGFATDSFIFLGFIPHKKRRQTILKEIAAEDRTVIFYESTHRIVKAMEQLQAYIDPQRRIVIGRELTKMYEELIRGNIETVLKHLKEHEIRGEFVVVVEGK